MSGGGYCTDAAGGHLTEEFLEGVTGCLFPLVFLARLGEFAFGKLEIFAIGGCGLVFYRICAAVAAMVGD